MIEQHHFSLFSFMCTMYVIVVSDSFVFHLM